MLTSLSLSRCSFIPPLQSSLHLLFDRERINVRKFQRVMPISSASAVARLLFSLRSLGGSTNIYFVLSYNELLNIYPSVKSIFLCFSFLLVHGQLICPWRVAKCLDVYVFINNTDLLEHTHNVLCDTII